MLWALPGLGRCPAGWPWALHSAARGFGFFLRHDDWVISKGFSVSKGRPVAFASPGGETRLRGRTDRAEGRLQLSGLTRQLQLGGGGWRRAGAGTAHPWLL